MIEPPGILLIDDDPAVGQAFRRRARGLFSVTATTDPKYALDLLRGPQAFAAVLSDLFMPGINGVTFLSAARTLAPRSKCYLFTGKVDYGSLRHDLAEAGGAHGFKLGLERAGQGDGVHPEPADGVHRQSFQR